METDATSSQSQSDNEDNNVSFNSIDDHLEIVKHEIEIKRAHEQLTEDLFGNDIMIPHVTPSSIKDRRESKEKSKRELEEEEREKMQ